MYISKGFSIIVQIRFYEDHSKISLTPKNQKPFSIKGEELTKLDLKETMESILDGLNIFRGGIYRLSGQDKIELYESLTTLYMKGYNLLNRLCDRDPEKFNKITNIFKRNCNINSNRPSKIQYITEFGQNIPIEILPVFYSPIPKKAIDNYQDLDNILRSFLGFSTIIDRQINGISIPAISDNCLQISSKLPIKLFVNREYEGSSETINYFCEKRKNNLNIDGDAPWPTNKRFDNSEKFAEEFSYHLWKCAVNCSNSNYEQKAQIIHLFCHCDTQSKIIDQHKLHLGNPTWFGNQIEMSVSKEKLEYYFGISAQEDHENHGDMNREIRPLIFLNACESSIIIPSHAVSFPKLFLHKKYGYRGFIGTMAKIPGLFASKFSERFYENLLEGNSLGQSIYDAKWHMVQRHHNPLGILYNFYANPDIRFRLR